MADTEADTWLPINQATALLGISQRTLYRRAEAGQYRLRRVDGRTQVRIAQPAAAEPAVAAGSNGERADAADTAVMADSADGASIALATMTDTLTRAVETLERLMAQDRQRADAAERQARDYAAAAAMWQERASNLKAENARLQELLALPAHEEEADRPPWWMWWRRQRPDH